MVQSLLVAKSLKGSTHPFVNIWRLWVWWSDSDIFLVSNANLFAMNKKKRQKSQKDNPACTLIWWWGLDPSLTIDNYKCFGRQPILKVFRSWRCELAVGRTVPHNARWHKFKLFNRRKIDNSNLFSFLSLFLGAATVQAALEFMTPGKTKNLTHLRWKSFCWVSERRSCCWRRFVASL